MKQESTVDVNLRSLYVAENLDQFLGNLYAMRLFN